MEYLTLILAGLLFIKIFAQIMIDVFYDDEESESMAVIGMATEKEYYADTSPSNATLIRWETITSGTANDYQSDEQFDRVVDLAKDTLGKSFCKYCHGKTFDDRYGHCEACGAPRNNQ